MVNKYQHYIVVNVDDGSVSHKWGTDRLSEDFKVYEFACNDGSEVVLLSRKLINRLQYTRTRIGKPLTINSAFRTISHNSATPGSSETSWHMYGLALDIATPEGMTDEDFGKELLHDFGHNNGFHVYNGYVHIDPCGYDRW